MLITPEDKNLIINHYSLINSKFTREFFDSLSPEIQGLIYKQYNSVVCKSKDMKKEIAESPSMFDWLFNLVLNSLLAFDKVMVNIVIKNQHRFTSKAVDKLKPKQKQKLQNFINKK